MAEEWRPVVGYEDSYEVSDRGRVRNVARIGALGRPVGGHILSPGIDHKGRRRVGLYRNSKGQQRLVHHLVLEAFVGPRPEGEVARHLDDNPRNNSLSNLAWGTHSENAMDQVRNGNHSQARKTHCLRGHPFDEQNTYLPKSGGRRCKTCMLQRAREFRERNPGYWEEYRKSYTPPTKRK